MPKPKNYKLPQSKIVTAKRRSHKLAITASIFLLIGLSLWMHHTPALPVESKEVRGVHTFTPKITGPNVNFREYSTTLTMPYGSITNSSSTLPIGTKRVDQAGVNGITTLNYKVTTINGKESKPAFIGSSVTQQPVTQIVTIGTGAQVAATAQPTYLPAATPAHTATPAICDPATSITPCP